MCWQKEDILGTIQVQIEGAVYPLSLKVPLGSSVADVLAKVRLLPEADLTEIDTDAKVHNGHIIVVPFKGKTTLYVYGEVECPKVVVVDGDPNAAKILEKVTVTQHADTRSFLRRKKFLSGSCLEIKARKALRKKNAMQRGNEGR